MIVDKSQLTQYERDLYIRLVQAYQKCYFASKRRSRGGTRRNAQFIKYCRINHPVVFIAFRDWIRIMWKSINESNGVI